MVQAPTLSRHIISGSISLPFRGSFHLSLTVLVRYRSLSLFSLGGWSPQLRAGLHVSDLTQEHSTATYILHLRGYHPLWRCFPAHFDYMNIADIEVLQPRSRCQTQVARDQTKDIGHK